MPDANESDLFCTDQCQAGRHMTRVLTTVLALIIVSAAPVSAADRTVTLDVDNLSCLSCGPILKRTLARVDGVSDVVVDVRQGQATVKFDDSRGAVAGVIDAATSAGYPARPANRPPRAAETGQ